MIFQSIQCLVAKGIISSETGSSLNRIASRLPENSRDNLKLLLGSTTSQSGEEAMRWSNNQIVEFSDGSNVNW